MRNRRSLKSASASVALDWIEANQLGRRNLTPDQRSLIRGRRYNRTKKAQGGDHKSKSQSDTLIDTATAIATRHGVSRATIIRDGKRAEAIEKLADALRPKAKEKQRKAGPKQGRGKKATAFANIGESDPIDTREQAAKEAGLSHGSLAAYRYLKENADPEELDELRREHRPQRLHAERGRRRVAGDGRITRRKTV
jgi:hypothetical protein